MYSKNGEIRRDETCLDYSGHEVVLYPCHGAKGNQLWLYDANVSFNATLNTFKPFIKVESNLDFIPSQNWWA